MPSRASRTTLGSRSYCSWLFWSSEGKPLPAAVPALTTGITSPYLRAHDRSLARCIRPSMCEARATARAPR